MDCLGVGLVEGTRHLLACEKGIPADPWTRSLAVYGVDEASGALNPHLALQIRQNEKFSKLLQVQTIALLNAEMALVPLPPSSGATEVSRVPSHPTTRSVRVRALKPIISVHPSARRTTEPTSCS